MQLDTMLTVDQYTRLPRQTGERLELSRGLLVRLPHPGAHHATVAARMYELLRLYARAHGGHVAFNTGFLLHEEPPTVRGPDVAFVASNRPLLPGSGVMRGGPDLAIEIAGPAANGARAEQLEKVFEYLDAGTTAVWLVDLAARAVTVYRAGDEPRVHAADDIIRGTGVLDGFACPVAAILA